MSHTRNVFNTSLSQYRATSSMVRSQLAIVEETVDRIWEKFLTDRDRVVFAASGYGSHGGFGKKPCLLVIDVSYGFTGDKPEPILDSIKKWRNSCGAESWGP
jgi:hypothetical protein